MEQNNHTECLTIYKVVMEETRCGAVFPGHASEVAHASRRLLTLHLKTCSLVTLFTIWRAENPGK